MDGEMNKSTVPLAPCRQKVNSSRAKNALKAFVGACGATAAAAMLSTSINCNPVLPPGQIAVDRVTTQPEPCVDTRPTAGLPPVNELTTEPVPLRGDVITTRLTTAPAHPPGIPIVSLLGDGGTYTIREHDTLYSIAKGQLGDANRWPEIKAANPGLDEKALPVGKVIKVPAK
jgi:nucleoid-associated protein YgaU